MADAISAALRQLVFERAEERCEYCLISQLVVAYKHEPDHIRPLQHDGGASADNLVLACARCNRYKGYNIGSFGPETGELALFFNPRKQTWSHHFRLQGARVEP